MKKGTIIFIPGYTLKSSVVFKSYASATPEWNHIFYDYFPYKDYSIAIDELVNLINRSSLRKVILVTQSLGFTIGCRSALKANKNPIIFGFNPMLRLPRTKFFPIWANKTFLELYFRFSQNFIGRKLNKRLVTSHFINQLRKNAGTSPEINEVSEMQVIYQSQEINLCDLMINPIPILMDEEISGIQQLKPVFFFSNNDILLSNDVTGPYYSNLCQLFPTHWKESLDGGHEAFIENKLLWIEAFTNKLKLIENAN